MDAYEKGLKGCTTYRPSDVRGSVLSIDDVPRLRDRAVDMILHCGLNGDVLGRRQFLRIDEVIGKGSFRAEFLVKAVDGKIAHLLFPPCSVRKQDFPRIGIGEDGLDAGRYIAREERDRTGGRDGGHKRIADAVFRDCLPYVAVEARDGFAAKIGIGDEERERTLFSRKIH